MKSLKDIELPCHPQKPYIEQLVDKSVFILRETKARFKNPAVMWSGGKDSTLMLELCKQAYFNSVPFPVIHLDTTRKFPEIYAFRDKIAKEWNLDLIVVKPDETEIKKHQPKGAEDEIAACCMALKVAPWKNIVKERRFDALIMSIRRDEHEMRNYERYFSPRDENWEWHLVKPKEQEGLGDAPFVAEQDTELAGWGIFATEFPPGTNHVRVHPLLPWTEEDVWTYTALLDLPFNPLYLNGYRSLGCECCTVKPGGTPPKDINEIIERIVKTPGKERSGRAQNKENAQAMRRLRMMGYP